jgi:hypothetical protein
MKHIKTLLAFALFAFPVSGISLLAQFGGGDGLTAATAYQIYNKAHLEELSDSVISSPSNNSATGYNWSRDKYFKVMNDITGPVTKMIGLPSSYRSFQGHFDGQDHTITVNINELFWVGLFPVIYVGSIKNVAITGSINAIQYSLVGGIVGNIITGDIASGNVKISNCVNSVNINSLLIATSGGIVGGIGVNSSNPTGNSELIIENCINIGSVKGLDAGGILGNCDVIIKGVCIVNNCENYGLIVGDSWGAGGIAGNINNKVTISNCFNGGVVEGGGSVGCIVGFNEGGTIINCHYDMQMCGE